MSSVLPEWAENPISRQQSSQGRQRVGMRGGDGIAARPTELTAGWYCWGRGAAGRGCCHWGTGQPRPVPSSSGLLVRKTIYGETL